MDLDPAAPFHAPPHTDPMAGMRPLPVGAATAGQQELTDDDVSIAALVGDTAPQQAEEDLRLLEEQFEGLGRQFAVLHAHCAETIGRIRDERRVMADRRRASLEKLQTMKQLGGSTVRLNVGGTVFQVSESVLRRYPGSFFDVMLECSFPLDRDDTGAILIDRDPVLFREVLHFMRTGDMSTILAGHRLVSGREVSPARLSPGDVPTEDDDSSPEDRGHARLLVADEVKRLEEEARFYGIDRLCARLSSDRWTWHRKDTHHVIDGDVPTPRCFAACQWVPAANAMFVFGGCTAEDRFYDSFYSVRLSSATPAPGGPGAAAQAGQRDVSNGEDGCRLERFTWTAVRPASGPQPPARSGHTLNLVDGHIVLLFGNNSTAMVHTVHAFNVAAKVWLDVTVTGDPIGPRSGHTATVVHPTSKTIYVIGGKLIFPTMRAYEDVFEGTVDAERCTLKWRRITTVGDPVDRRAYHTSVAYDGCLYVFGGIVNNVYCADLCRFDPRTSEWRLFRQGTPGSYIPTQPRSGHVALVSGNEMFVFGSYSDDQQDVSVLVLDLDSLVWRSLPTKGVAPSRCAAAGAVLLPGNALLSELPRLVMFGGFDITSRRCFNEVCCLTL